MTTPTTLYRFYGKDDVLLYVGIAGNPGRRFDQHATDKRWWDQVTRSTMEHLPTRAEAEQAERDAIRYERPLHNVAHNHAKHTSDAVAALRGGGAPAPWMARPPGIGDLIDSGRLVKVDDLADAFGCTRAHIYNLMKRGLPSVKVGGCRRFRVADCMAWLEAAT